MNLEELRNKALKDLERVRDLSGLESWRVGFLGRKSELSLFLRDLRNLPIAQRRRLGSEGNNLRRDLEERYRRARSMLSRSGDGLVHAIDVSRPGREFARGHIHPLTQVLDNALEFFSSAGFSAIEGPEVETEYYNFDALNIPSWHPARDLMDTFWLKQRAGSRLLLRTHTSPNQIHYMETHRAPLRIVAPGRVFRHEATDARHEAQFHQLEGLMVGDDVSLANFKYIIGQFFRAMFGPSTTVKLRPSYFPFVEPGLEVLMRCVCGGKRRGCRVCGGSGWLEMAGAGMVHPNVFRAVGYDPRDVQGFAFGVGIDRMAMIKYGVDDIRLFYSGDLRFVTQF